MSAEADSRRVYRKLITSIASELDDNDKSQLEFQNELGPGGRQLSALDIFTQLEKKGIIGPAKIKGLRSILEDINRRDLINRFVDPFDQKHRHHSLTTGAVLLQCSYSKAMFVVKIHEDDCSMVYVMCGDKPELCLSRI